jgi:signal transduction histidine kinase
VTGRIQAAAGAFRLPRRTLRTQLTLLYAVPFFISGAALLSVPILQTRKTIPVDSMGGPVGSRPDVSPGAPPGTNLDHLLSASAIGLAVMVLISLVLGWLIAGRFLRPLRSITTTAREISASNLHQRLNLSGRDDEFKELGQTLDDLFERLQASFDSQRHFVANASHELRSPLTAERTLLQVALADPDTSTESLRAACQDVLALGEQQERLIEALLTLASSERGIEQRETFDLAEIAEAVAVARQPEARRRGVQVDTVLAPAPAAGDRNLVESLAANLVDNAIRHNLTGGRIEIATATTAGRPSLSVRNTGPVIPSDQLERLFQPFQQLGGQRLRHRDGHGLGLAIVRAIARAHGATLIPRARPGGGLDIQVTFPGGA